MSPDWRPLRAGFQPDVRAKGLSWRQQFRQPAADTGRDFDDKTPELAALEAKVRRLEARAPRGPDYDNALSNLYEAYLEAGGFLPEAAATARKLLRLREKELKASDPRITDAMIDLGTSLARGKPWEEQGQEEARRVLEQALGRLSTVPKRLPASEFAVLSWMAYLEKRTAPELEILERMTAIAQSNIDELGHDALKEHRLRVKDFRHSLSTRGEAFGNASYKERALAAGRKAWLAHETFAIKRWEAYARSKNAWKGDDPHPLVALTDFYVNQALSEASFLGRLFGSSDTLDDSVEPRERGARLLILPPSPSREEDGKLPVLRAHRIGLCIAMSPH